MVSSIDIAQCRPYRMAFIYGAGVFIVELVSELFDDYGVWAFIASIISTIILGTAVFLGQQDW